MEVVMIQRKPHNGREVEPLSNLCPYSLTLFKFQNEAVPGRGLVCPEMSLRCNKVTVVRLQLSSSEYFVPPSNNKTNSTCGY